MKADFDFKPYVCEAIRLNGWDNPEHPVCPDDITGKLWEMVQMRVGSNTLEYAIEPDRFMLANLTTVQLHDYTVDDEGDLILIDHAKDKSPVTETEIETGLFVSGDSWLMKRDPVSWLIEDWIPEGKGLLQLYGASGTGKSFLAIDWMLSLVMGVPDWKNHGCKQGNVVYLCGEGQRGVAKRIKAWLFHHSIDRETAMKALHDNSLCLSDSAVLTLDNKKQLEEMQRAIDERDFKPDLIIVDTLNRFMAGNENDTRDATAFVHACDSLAGKYNCAVMLIHHVGWSTDAQNRARGSSVIHSSVDLDFQLKDCNGTLELSQDKNKDHEKSHPVYMALSGVPFCDEDGFPERSAVLITADKPEVELTKDITRQNDEILCLEAFKAFAVDRNGVVAISIDDFKRHCEGKLTDRNGKPYEGTTFTNQFNPNQGKFISRLLGYRVIEPLGDNRSEERRVGKEC